MAENIPPPVWPPSRTRTRPLLLPTHNDHELALQGSYAVPPIQSTQHNHANDQIWAPSLSAAKKIWKNGYESAPKTVSFEPYAMSRRGGASKRAGLFTETDTFALKPLPPLSVPEWNALARSVAILPVAYDLRTFQMQGSNLVIARKKDLVVISWTGSGKSVLFSLALHAQKRGISIVVTPYTTLGKEESAK